MLNHRGYNNCWIDPPVLPEIKYTAGDLPNSTDSRSSILQRFVTALTISSDHHDINIVWPDSEPHSEFIQCRQAPLSQALSLQSLCSRCLGLKKNHTSTQKILLGMINRAFFIMNFFYLQFSLLQDLQHSVLSASFFFIPITITGIWFYYCYGHRHNYLYLLPYYHHNFTGLLLRIAQSIFVYLIFLSISRNSSRDVYKLKS